MSISGQRACRGAYGIQVGSHQRCDRRDQQGLLSPGHTARVGLGTCADREAVRFEPGGLSDRLIPLLEGRGEEQGAVDDVRSEEHTSELQSRENLVCRLLLEKKKKKKELTEERTTPRDAHVQICAELSSLNNGVE